jgi:predicted amidohydrolase
MVTRALENRLFIITANRTGTERRGRFTHRFTGMSQIVSPEGRILTKADEKEEVLSVVRINPRMAENKRITPLNDIIRDRRKALYGRSMNSS